MVPVVVSVGVACGRPKDRAPAECAAASRAIRAKVRNLFTLHARVSVTFLREEGKWLMFQAHGVYPRVYQPVLLSEPPKAAKRSRQGYHAAQTEPKVGHG